MQYLYYGVGIILVFLSYCLCYQTLFFVRFKWPKMMWIALIVVIAFTELRMATAKYPIFIETSFMGCFLGIFILSKSKRPYILPLYPIIFMLYTCVNLMCSYVLSLACNIPYARFIKSLPLGVVTDFMAFLIFLIFYRVFIWNNNREEIRLSAGEYVILLIGSFCVFMIVAIAQSLMEGEDLLINILKQPFAISMTVLSFIFIVGLVWITFLKNKTTLYQTENELYKQFMIKQEEHVRDVVEADKKMRAFRHDINGHIKALEGCLNNDDYDTLKLYLERMKENSLLKSSKSISGIAAVDAIAGEWEEIADSQGIEWKWEGKINTKSEIDLFDLCILFSNILSNAVEAAQRVGEGRKKYITTQVETLRGKIVICVSNSCLETTGKSKLLKTSKEDKVNHGFGINNIRRIVEKYEGDLSIKLENSVFEIMVII